MRRLLFITTGLSLIRSPDAAVNQVLRAGLAPAVDQAIWPPRAPGGGPPPVGSLRTDVGSAECLAANVERLYSQHVRPQWPKPARRGCAELDTMLAMAQADPTLLDGDAQVRLLASDTDVGEFCARVIATAIPLIWPKVSRENVRPYLIRGLDAANPSQFAPTGITELAETVLGAVDEVRPHEIDLNVSGGFKGTIPFLSLLAVALGARLHYLFEFSTTLISLPRFHAHIASIGPVDAAYHPLLKMLGRTYAPPPRP